ncbi:MAG TPA: OmpH family outer membrane protein [Vicinamibacterales bacterium]|jgi:Skp family chaperone for outer membrane proteins
MFRSARCLIAAVILAALSTTTAFAAQAADPARVGCIRLSYVTNNSKAGKAALAQLQEFGRKKTAEMESKAAEVQKQQGRDQEKGRIELERLQQDAKSELEALRLKFDAEFQVKLAPIVDAVSKERGLHFVFGIEQAAIVWWSPAQDISEEVVKRLDALK